MSTPAGQEQLPPHRPRPDEPVLVMASILAGLQVLTGGAVLNEVIGDKGAGIAALVVAALTMALGTYTRGKVTPVSDAAAIEEDDGTLIAGPAAEHHAPVVEGEQVVVLPAEDVDLDNLPYRPSGERDARS